jgi:hypothetical protein
MQRTKLQEQGRTELNLFSPDFRRDSLAYDAFLEQFNAFIEPQRSVVSEANEALIFITYWDDEKKQHYFDERFLPAIRYALAIVCNGTNEIEDSYWEDDSIASEEILQYLQFKNSERQQLDEEKDQRIKDLDLEIAKLRPALRTIDVKDRTLSTWMDGNIVLY